MVYFLNTNINQNKKVNLALQQIFGIGKALSSLVCQRLGLSENIKFNKLNHSHVEQISSIINENFYFGNEYKQLISKQKKTLIDISSYRGFRFKQGLPSRGQRTHTNAKTFKKMRLNNSKLQNSKLQNSKLQKKQLQKKKLQKKK